MGSPSVTTTWIVRLDTPEKRIFADFFDIIETVKEHQTYRVKLLETLNTFRVTFPARPIPKHFNYFINLASTPTRQEVTLGVATCMCEHCADMLAMSYVAHLETERFLRQF